MTRAELAEKRPIRLFLAIAVGRIIWWPFVALCLPFACFAMVIEYASDTLFPAIARATSPVGNAVYSSAIAVSDAILGYKEEKEGES